MDNTSRGWRTQMELIGGGDATKTMEFPYEEGEFSTVYKTYSLMEVKNILTRIRLEEKSEGQPERKLAPVTRWLLEELIHQYFKTYAPKGAILQKIVIEDSKRYGI